MDVESGKTRRWQCLLLALIVLCGCGRAVNRAAERRIRDALPDLLGPAREYRVHVANAPERTLSGQLANVTVDGDAITLTDGLLLDHLHLDLSGVDIDTRRGRVRSIREARFAATLSEASLDEYLAGESPEGETIRHARLSLHPGQVTIAAERVTLGIGVPFRMTGPLRVVGPQRIEIDPTRLTVVGIPISGLPLRFLKSRFESALDLSHLPFPVQVSEAQVAEGSLTLSGTANVDRLLAQAQQGKQ